MAEDKNLLTSWKEIAAYLGRDVRTCLRWERNLGLPVHRLDPESEKSRVFAYKDELSEWLHKSKTSRPQTRAAAGRPSRRALFLTLLFTAVAAAAVALFFFIRRAASPGDPADFAIKGSVLAILDDVGRLLWRYDTGLENLADEGLYRAHFQFKRTYHAPDLPYLAIRDIDRDGRKDVLFSVQTVDERGEGELLCFDRKGRVLWSFKAGREMKYGSKNYSGDYRIAGFSADDLDADGRLEIIVIACHRPDWPCQLAVLDSSGHVKGEFWNSGYFGDLVTADLNGDGFKEILAGGVNNEYGRGCLAVFDAASIRGGSPQTSPEFRCPELEPGSELFYLLFPRTDVDLAEGYPVEAIVTVELLSNRRIQVKTNLSRIYFDFSPSLNSPELIVSHGFILAHEKALLGGKVKSRLNSEYKKDLLKGIRYWNGEVWVPEPAMNRTWEQLRLPLPDLAVKPFVDKRD
jgi:hypothetical protein